jgi:hypothetical protein
MNTKQRVAADTLNDEEEVECAMFWDALAVRDGEKIRIEVEPGEPTQEGVRLECDGGLVVDGRECPWIDLWMGAAPLQTVIECHTSDGVLRLYDLFVRCAPGGSQSVACLMVDNLPGGGRRYRCRSIDAKVAAHRLAFVIERVPRVELTG